MFVWNDSSNNKNDDDRNADNSRSISDCFKSFRLKFETCCSNYQWFILIRFLFAMSWQLQNAYAWLWWTHWDACIECGDSERGNSITEYTNKLQVCTEMRLWDREGWEMRATVWLRFTYRTTKPTNKPTVLTSYNVHCRHTRVYSVIQHVRIIINDTLAIIWENVSSRFDFSLSVFYERNRAMGIIIPVRINLQQNNIRSLN